MHGLKNKIKNTTQTTLNAGYFWYCLGHHLKSGSWSKTRCEPLDDSTIKGAENKPRNKPS